MGGSIHIIVFQDHWPLTPAFMDIESRLPDTFFHRNIRTKNGCEKMPGNKVDLIER